MYAIITGASSGIGKDIAYELKEKGYNLILVARREGRLNSIKKELTNNSKIKVEIFPYDLSIEENCYKLYSETKQYNVDILVNNAGFGLFGSFVETDLSSELEMIKTNSIAPHILTKLFLKDFVKKDKGKILNVCSSASFYYGPLMATYYSSKSYLYSLTLAIYEELKHLNSNVIITALTPGPVKTEFQEKADVKFATKALSSKLVAKAGIDGLFKGKLIVIPGFTMKLGKFASRFISDKMILKVSYRFQTRKKD